MKFFLAATTGLSLLAMSIRTTDAQEQKKRERPRLDAAYFDQLDKNRDGIVTREEIPAEQSKRTEKIFDRFDRIHMLRDGMLVETRERKAA